MFTQNEILKLQGCEGRCGWMEDLREATCSQVKAATVPGLVLPVLEHFTGVICMNQMALVVIGLVCFSCWDEYIFMCVVGGKLCPKLSGSSLTLYAIWDQSCLFIVPWFPFLRKKYSWRCMNEWCGGWITPVSFQMSSEYQHLGAGSTHKTSNQFTSL